MRPADVMEPKRRTFNLTLGSMTGVKRESFTLQKRSRVTEIIQIHCPRDVHGRRHSDLDPGCDVPTLSQSKASQCMCVCVCVFACAWVLTALANTPMSSGNWCVSRASMAVKEQRPAVKRMKKGSSFFG